MFHLRWLSEEQSGGDCCCVLISRTAEQASQRRGLALMRTAKLEVVNAKA
jgi:hypothetical protein